MVPSPSAENRAYIWAVTPGQFRIKGFVLDKTFPTHTFFVSCSTPDRVTSLSPDESCSRDDFVFRVEVFRERFDEEHMTNHERKPFRANVLLRFVDATRYLSAKKRPYY